MDTSSSLNLFTKPFHPPDLGGLQGGNPYVARYCGNLSDNYPSWSPFTYTFNNPIRFIDPDGMGTGEGGDGKTSSTQQQKTSSSDASKIWQGTIPKPRNTTPNQQQRKTASNQTSKTPSSPSKNPANGDAAGQGGEAEGSIYIEKTLGVLSSEPVSAIATFTDDVLKVTKGMGHVATGLSVANDSYHRYVKKDLSTGRYIYRTTGAALGTALTVFNNPAGPLVGPSIFTIEKAYDQVKFQFENIYNRVNNMQWWGGQFGY